MFFQMVNSTASLNNQVVCLKPNGKLVKLYWMPFRYLYIAPHFHKRNPQKSQTEVWHRFYKSKGGTFVEKSPEGLGLTTYINGGLVCC